MTNGNNVDMKVVLAQLNQWCRVNNVSVQSVYDQCKGMTLEELVYYLFGVVRDAIDQFVVTQGEFDELYKFVHDYFDNLDVSQEVKDAIDEMISDGRMETIITSILQGVVNAVIEGIDNTGTTDVGTSISNLLQNNTGRRVYFPAGTYKINNPVYMYTHGNYRGNMLICDPNARFITDGITTMFIIGNNTTAAMIEEFGLEGGYIDATGVTECVIKVNNLQYSPRFRNLIIRNIGNATGISLGTGQGTSMQAMLDNIVITGDGTVRGIGLEVNATDNYFTNIDIGRMKRNVQINGGGNLFTNLHTWNYGREYEALGVTSPEEKLTYSSIRVSGSNLFNCVQVDNGTPAIDINQYAVQNEFSGINFNYEADFPWATSTDECCAIYVSGTFATLGNNFDFQNVSLQPNNDNQVRLIKFHDYSNNTVYPSGVGWRVELNNTRQMTNRFMLCDWARTIYKRTPILTNYINTVTDTSKCSLLGYIGLTYGDMVSKWKFEDGVGGEIDVVIKVASNVVSITKDTKTAFKVNMSLLFGNEIIIVNGYKVIPVYLQFKNVQTYLNGLYATPLSVRDIFNSFTQMDLYTEIDTPTGVTEINLYS